MDECVGIGEEEGRKDQVSEGISMHLMSLGLQVENQLDR